MFEATIAATAATPTNPETVMWMLEQQGSRIDLLVNLLTFFSTVLLGIFALLTWSHIKSKDRAERAVDEIVRMKNEMKKLYIEQTEMYKALKVYTESAKKLLVDTTTKTRDEFTKVVDEFKKRGVAIKGLDERINKAHRFLDQSAANLGAISDKLPDLTARESFLGSTSTSTSGGRIEDESSVAAARSLLEIMKKKDASLIQEALRQRLEREEKGEK